MSEPERLTAAQERAAVSRIGENLALRSGAGCGKTFVLARRFTELVMSDPSADPLPRLAALTFTDKAALEMAQRVRRFLKDAADKATGESRRRLLGWLEGLSEARISTIHSFCASLLRTSAIEAGVDPDFAVCSDELLARQLAGEAAEQAVLQAIERQHQPAVMLLATLSLEKVIGLVTQLIEKRTSAELNDYRDPAAVLARWRHQAEEQGREAWATLKADPEIATLLADLEHDSAGASRDDKLTAFIRDKLPLARSILRDPAAATLDAFQEMRRSPGNIGSSEVWGGREGVKEVRRRVKELGLLIGEYGIYAEQLGPADEQAASALAALAELAIAANDIYSAAKRGRGMLDFTDLLEAAERLLKDDPALARSLGEGIGQLLVDECQDTDAFQVRLLERLVRLGAKGGLPEGRLFIVGDAKQSIYRFRGAQVEVFQDWCRRLGAGRQEDLDLSFRTHAAGAAFVNHLFAPLMGDDYSPIKANRSESPPGPAVEIILANGVGGEAISSADQSVAAQAAATAERIQQMIAGGEKKVWDEKARCWRAVRPGDIAILLSRMPKSLEFERALAGREIPYYVVAGSGFFRQQEVFDVLNALRAIDNPLDDVALIGVLRSSMFGLDDNALLSIALAHRPPYWPALAEGDGPEGLEESSRATLALACQTISRLHRDKDALGVDRLVEEVVSASGYEATLLAQREGRRMLGNVRRLLDQARAAEEEGLALADFVARMDELVLEESRYEQAAVAGEAEDVVRLMTIHKAKGLEFPVVFVPDLNFAPRGEVGTILLRSDWGLTVNLKPARQGDSQEQDDGEEGRQAAAEPLSFRLAKLLEDRDQDREDIRKLYVAVTRARDHVVLVGANWRADDGAGAFKEQGSFLARVDAVLGIGWALDGGAAAIQYDDGRYGAELKVVSPGTVEDGRSGRSAGQKMLAAAATGADLARQMLAAAPTDSPAPPLVGALPVSAARAELAVTALNDFARCPMLYRWRHELRVPTELIAQGDDVPEKGAQQPGRIDPATLGTLLHLCMEMLDFASPAPAPSLIAAAACRLELDEAIDTDLLAGQLQDMLGRFQQHPLLASLRSARALLRELDFTASAGPATLRGQIDLLYQDDRGNWRIIDYKSDQVDEANLAEHAGGYQPQLLAYASAASRYLGHTPTEALLYFLRPGQTHSLTITADALEAGEARLAQTAQRLIAARRSGQFERSQGDLCPVCPYRRLCLRAGKSLVARPSWP